MHVDDAGGAVFLANAPRFPPRRGGQGIPLGEVEQQTWPRPHRLNQVNAHTTNEDCEVVVVAGTTMDGADAHPRPRGIEYLGVELDALRSVAVLASPIRDGAGRFAGLVVETLGSTTVAEHVAQVGGDKDMLAFLVDGQGRVIAHPNSALVARFADLSASSSVAAFLQTDASSGTVTYSPSDGSGVQLAGFALVTDLGWGAIVERPAAVALAGVRTARELAFVVLLAFLGVVVIVTVVTTRLLTRPLAVLADVARRHSTGDYAAPLPASGMTEIARLAAAFRLMRAAVVERTRERDQAGTKLRDSEARIRQLMDAVPVGIFVMNADGIPYYANAATQRLLGTGIVPTSGTNALAALYQVYVAETDRLYPTDRLPIVRALAGETVTARDLEVRLPHGEPILLDVRATPIFDDSGAVQFGMVTFTDMSEHRRLEMQLRLARDEALDASGAKSEFLATMSHEIRTPMNGVIGMSGLLIETELTPRQFEYADTVRRSGEALLVIINDILDFSKLEAGKLAIELGAVNVPQAVEDVIELLADRAQSKGVELAAVGDPHVPVGMLGDTGGRPQLRLFRVCRSPTARPRSAQTATAVPARLANVVPWSFRQIVRVPFLRVGTLLGSGVLWRAVDPRQ